MQLFHRYQALKSVLFPRWLSFPTHLLSSRIASSQGACRQGRPMARKLSCVSFEKFLIAFIVCVAWWRPEDRQRCGASSLLPPLLALRGSDSGVGMCLTIAFIPCSHLQTSSFELLLRHVCARTRVSGVSMLPCVSRQRSEMGSDILTSTFLYLSFETECFIGPAAHHFVKTLGTACLWPPGAWTTGSGCHVEIFIQLLGVGS